jgi:hypothetical protein
MYVDTYTSVIMFYTYNNNLGILKLRYNSNFGQGRMDNPQRTAALYTQDTGRRQTKQTTQQRKIGHIYQCHYVLYVQ